MVTIGWNLVEFFYSKLLKKLTGRALVNVSVGPGSVVEAGSSVRDSVLGRHSFCGYDCSIYNANIGSFVSIASEVVIGAAEHPMDWISTSPVFSKGRDSVRTKFSEFLLPAPKTTKVGSDVWIGHRAIILSGVVVGHGAVVGAGAVVTKDVPPYSVVGGVPAKKIGMRFPDKHVEALVESKWWDLPDPIIARSAKFAKDPMRFLAHVMEEG